VSARLGEAMWDRGKLVEALERMDTALSTLSSEDPDADLAALAAQVGRFRFFSGDLDVAMERIETALGLAEELNLPDVLSQALNTKGVILVNSGRYTEGGALVGFALDVALENDIPADALRGYNNVADINARADRFERAAAVYGDGLALARRVGNRSSEWQFLAQTYPLYCLGRWDEALALAAEVPEESYAQIRFPFVCLVGPSASILAHRGDVDGAARLAGMHPELRDSDDLSERSAYAWAEAVVLLARGEAGAALDVAERSWATRGIVGASSEGMKEGFAQAVDAALALGRLDRAERILAELGGLPRGLVSQSMRAHASRLRARLAAAAGDDDRADRLFRGAAGLFRELAMPFPMAVALLDHAEWMAAGGRGDPAGVLADAREAFERLAARPWLDRVERVAVTQQAAASAP
jgi:tetratricopeptide (TPR) repeat protein